MSLLCSHCVDAPAATKWEKYRLCTECHAYVKKHDKLPEQEDTRPWGFGCRHVPKKPSMDEQLGRVLIPIKGTDFCMDED